MPELTVVDAATVRHLAALAGLTLTPERAAAYTAALQELLAADAAVAALKLGGLSGVGRPWGDWTDEPDRRG